MKKLLLGFGALCLAGMAAPAMAQGWGGFGYGYGGYADTVRQHVRACRQHERFHERMAREHAIEHDQGFDDGDDHDDAHDALDEAHDEYHDDHPGVGNCRYWNSQYYGMLNGYNYPRRSYGYSGGYPGWSFSFRGE